ncbi:protein FAM177A1 isoform X2 [Halyomorpha halys]|uniref:protein FAM177A1 isoform X2 n=1 Tax=Halyomorpha halys TaxID=286706 RepID=UPI0006D4F96E|nr:protein FAM177A1 isoform X2 [Halyomorpha halys]
MSKVGVYEPSQEQDSMKTLPLSDSAGAEAEPKKRVPKRILHFSDGTLEEYSSDEDGSDISQPHYEIQLMQSNLNNPPWMPWFWYHTVYFGTKALAVCDYLGESLANFFGIISPKYEYEIEQYKKMIAEEEERRKQDIELGGWRDNTSATEVTSPVQTEPLR